MKNRSCGATVEKIDTSKKSMVTGREQIQVVLNPREVELLGILAEKCGTSKSGIIKECILRVLESYNEPV